MTRFKRADRVAGEIQRDLSSILAKEIRDPRLDSVTIIRVHLSDDLRSARVYFSVSEGEKRKDDALAGFKSASGYLKRKLGERLELRYMPELKFIYDESFDRATEVNKILQTISEESGTTENQ